MCSAAGRKGGSGMRYSAEYDGLFPEPRPVMLRACLRGEMGRVLAAGPDSALALIGDFCFLAGRPDRGLLRKVRVPLIISTRTHWAITRSGCTFPPLNLSTISTWISLVSRNHRGSPCPVFIDAAPAFSNMSIS